MRNRLKKTFFLVLHVVSVACIPKTANLQRIAELQLDVKSPQNSSKELTRNTRVLKMLKHPLCAAGDEV